MANATRRSKRARSRERGASRRLALRVGFVIAASAAFHVARADPVPAAVFPFALEDTSLPGEAGQGREADLARLRALDTQLRDMLAADGRYKPADITAIADQVQTFNLRGCNGCDLDLARRVGARVSVLGWVQKVSNLILNINVIIRDVADGRILQGGSVDIRGDNDEAWSRGMKFLFRNVLFPSSP